MAMKATKVGLAKTGRRRSNVFEALDNILDDITPKVREQVVVETKFPFQYESTCIFTCGCDARCIGLSAQRTTITK